MSKRTVQLRAITLLGIITSMVTGITLGVMLAKRTQGPNQTAQEAQMLEQVFTHVSAHYVDNVSKEQLVDDALRGMIEGLDKHSKYLDQSVYGEMQTDATGHFGGIGIELGLVDNLFTVVKPIKNTPADTAGIQAGDNIIAVDGKPLRGQLLREVIDRLRGEPGSQLSLKLKRGDDVFTVLLTRQDIAVQSVFVEALEDGVVYARITQFHKDTHKDLVKRLQQANAQPNGVILDLRNNPGGLLGASVDVAGEFLNGELIVSTQGRQQTNKREFRAGQPGAYTDVPLVVLINGGSASAAEIVAGALRDHQRATLMGSTTYGKGSVQSVLALPGNRGVKLTTAYYHTPLGQAIHGKGVKPDVQSDARARELVRKAQEHLKSQLKAAPKRLPIGSNHSSASVSSTPRPHR